MRFSATGRQQQGRRAPARPRSRGRHPYLQRDAGWGVGETVRIFSELGKEPLQASISSTEHQLPHHQRSGADPGAGAAGQGRRGRRAGAEHLRHRGDRAHRTSRLTSARWSAWRDAKRRRASFWTAASASAERTRPKNASGTGTWRSWPQPARRTTCCSAPPTRTAELAGLQASKGRRRNRGERKPRCPPPPRPTSLPPRRTKVHRDGPHRGREVNKAPGQYRRNLATEQSGRVGRPAAIQRRRDCQVEGNPRAVRRPQGPGVQHLLRRPQPRARHSQSHQPARRRRRGKSSPRRKSSRSSSPTSCRMPPASHQAQLAGLQVKAREVVAAQERADAQALEPAAAQQVPTNAALVSRQEKAIEDFIARSRPPARRPSQRQDRASPCLGTKRPPSPARDLSVSLAEAVELVAIARTEEAQSRLQSDSAAFADLQRENRRPQRTARPARHQGRLRASDKAAKTTRWTPGSARPTRSARALTDALMQGGKSAWGVHQGLFRSTVLRPIIQGVVNPIAGPSPVAGSACRAGAAAAWVRRWASQQPAWAPSPAASPAASPAW